MKLAFSTLGCPDFSWADIYSMAKDFGFRGIEMRGLGGDIAESNFTVHASPFQAENLARTRAELKRLHLEICCLSSGCSLRDPAKHAETIAELREYIAVAAALGTPYIRVLGDPTAEPTTDFDDENVISAMRILAEDAENAGVTLLLENYVFY